MSRGINFRWLGVILLAALVAAGGREVAAAEAMAGKLVQVQGQVTVRRAGAAVWEPARVNQDLFPGDAVQTGPLSRAAILAADESQIKLNENTLFVLKSAAPSARLGWGETVPAAAPAGPAVSLYQVPRGEIWLRNSNEKFRFELETPAVTAAVRGTEFNLRVAADGFTSLALLTGLLELVNPQGRLLLNPGEEGLARPGEAPSKRVLLSPPDAVQWSLYYPGIVSFRDLPLSAGAGAASAPEGAVGVAALVGQAEAEYDQGNPAQAREAAAAALARDPGNPGALTVLGWISLQRHEPREAEHFFRQVRLPEERAVIGLALAWYRQGKVRDAVELMARSRARLAPGPRFTAMEGYFALMAGQVDRAHTLLVAAAAQDQAAALPRALLAQIYLVQNRKDQARTAAGQALAADPRSPVSHLSLALVEMASFRLDAARARLEKAISLDPGFVDAYLYLARLWLGGDYLDRARQTLDTALKLAREEAEVLSLAGFVRLGYRDFDGAAALFRRAIQANPGLGEPHLGLGHCFFRERDPRRGLTEILTATLLEPRVSLYQSFLGKSLYQVRAFDKALKTYDYAKTLDPRDPTPYLYKGIALTDLNRPGEAVTEFNRSIDLNDNQAVFRSRLMLDRDLAVRNYNLAYAYTNLGLDDWAYSKALTAVKADPTNSSAQLFLASTFSSTRQRVGASGSALLLYRLLSPANQNTFSKGNDYTPMFEMPYLRTLAAATGGLWDSRSQTIQNYSLEVYGGLPGAAGDVSFNYLKDEGFRRHNSDLTNYSVLGFLKWEPQPKTSLYAFSQYFDTDQGDRLYLSDGDYRNMPFWRQRYRTRIVEGGLVQRFTPNAIFLAYMSYTRISNRTHNFETGSGSTPYDLKYYDLGPGQPPLPPGWYAIDQGVADYTYKLYRQTTDDLQFFNPQVQHMLILGPHTLMAGFDYFRGKTTYRYSEQLARYFHTFTYGLQTFLVNGNTGQTFDLGQWWDPYIFPLNERDSRAYLRNFGPPKWSYTAYLLDYWRVAPNLIVELGGTLEAVKTPQEAVGRTTSKTKVNPRLGINYSLTPQHTLRLGAYTTMSPHPLFQASLLPGEVAGVPYQINAFDGADVREIGASWEAQWGPRTFTFLRAGAFRVSNPLIVFDNGPVTWLTWKEYYTSLVFNQIIGPYVGLSLGAAWKRVDHQYDGTVDFNELDAGAKLVFWHKSGFRAYVSSLLVYQKPTTQASRLFGLANAGVGYELPGKRGLIFLNVTNIFNRRSGYLLEPIRLDPFFASRQITLRAALYF
jgi:tetratricopeptide (TPR) repeat protein